MALALPSVGEILGATGATRSRAYELAKEIHELLPGLDRGPGRPRAVREPVSTDALAELRGEALRFVMNHPGCVHLGAARARYSETWRLFVLGLCERHPDVPLADLADAVCMPHGTLEDWLRAPRIEALDIDEHDEAAAQDDAKRAQIETVLAAWRAWRGDFSSFCEHVRRDHRVEVGKTTIASILFVHGERTPTRRRGRSRDERALRGAFETFFPGAQWVGDGKTLEVLIDGEVLHVNLELAVDAASGAAVGIAVSDEEDSKAVCDAFESGVQTTSVPPLALLLDNRPSNHTPEIDAALGETLRMRSTLGRAQNKAHVEGAFGLFAQKVPTIELDTREPRALARTIATIVALTFFRALNRAPRRDRDGKTRIALYSASVTPEEREAAKAALHERMRRQELARQTRAARLDPVVSALLDHAFAHLELCDPERHVRDAIAGYPRDAIVDAIAIFDGKRARGTLPEGVDARYLLGIVKNIDHLREAECITEALLRERLAARDRFLGTLLRERDQILAERDDIAERLDAFVDRAVHADREIDRHFWLDACVGVFPITDQDARKNLFRRAARRIHAVFRVPTRDRSHIERILLRRLWPLE